MNSLVISTSEQEKAYLHPVRMKILGWLTEEPMTISHVAKRMSVHPANLTHHFRRLEKAKLIELSEERDTGRVVEKYYSAVAKGFHIKREHEDGANAKVLSFLANDLAAAVEGSKPDDSEAIIGLIKRAKISSDVFGKFTKRLRSLIEEFEAASEKNGTLYALNVSLYPHKADYGPLEKIEYTKKRRKKK